MREKAVLVATCVCYLGAFFCLVTFGKAPGGFGKLVKRLRRGWLWRTRRLLLLYPDTGYCYQAKVADGLISDAEGKSRVVVFEDGVPLPTPHAIHNEIRQRGLGAYSHWNNVLYFSTSDNTDPRSNGRHYTYAEA